MVRSEGIKVLKGAEGGPRGVPRVHTLCILVIPGVNAVVLSLGGDFAPQGTLGSVWRHFGLSQWGGATCV